MRKTEVMKSNPFEQINLPNFQETLTKLTQANLGMLQKYTNMLMDSSMDSELMHSYAELGKQIFENPNKWMELQARFYQNQFQILTHFWTKQMGAPVDIPLPERKDNRFKNDQWDENPVLEYLKHSYLLASEFLLSIPNEFQLSEADKKKIKFHTRQYVNAMSPTNFALSNPDVIQEAIDTQGKSLVDGLENLIEDLEKGRMTMTDESKFEVGKNIAVTEGSVVFENELIQLIQYKPLTEKVHEFPLIILPPWINKFYILDLSPENSYAKWIVEQGYTVFMVSWKSADESIAHLTWEDYIELGSLPAIEAAKSICKVNKVNVLGFCIGGTVTANTLAILTKRRSKAINSATFLATMLDFRETGEIGIIVDNQLVEEAEKDFESGGVLDGNTLANTFAILRENDLVWNYVVNNYLKGKTPPPFDLLYWNGDPTSLPGKMYSYYLRNMYLENNLIKPNCLTHLGVKIDISSIQYPCYFIATIEDHIAPWKTIYPGFLQIKAEKKFVLGGSGHIAGIVNHPAKKKRNYWTNDQLPETTEEWLATASNHEGSWWSDWIVWLDSKNEKMVNARVELGSTGFPEIEPAPGRYVKMKI